MNRRHAFCCAAAALVTGCFSGARSSETFEPTTGSIDVVITAPRGVVPKVVMHGPGNFKKELTDTASLTGLVAGEYWFEAPSLVVATSIVDTVYSVALPAEPYKLEPTKSLEIKLAYVARPGSGGIWATRFGDARLLAGWQSQTLLRSASLPPDARVLTSYDTINGIQVDTGGNVWMLVHEAGLDSFVKIAGADLVAGESEPKTALLQASARLLSFTFDASGGIWAVSRTGTLVHYSAAQLALGSLGIADVTLHPAAGSLSDPGLVATDLVGNLWVTDHAGSGSLNRFSPRVLATSGYAPPSTQLLVPAPGAFAFDALGSCWIVSQGGQLLRYDPSQLGLGGAPLPSGSFDLGSVQIHSLAFDAIGELWLSYTDPVTDQTRLGMLSSGQLAGKTGKPTPWVAAQTQPGRSGPSLILMDPTPAGLPLFGIPK